MRISVIGDGGWGTALAILLAGNGHAVTVWGPFEDTIDSIRHNGENTTYLPKVKIPDAIRWTTDREETAVEAELVVLAVPSKFFSETAQAFSTLIPAASPVVSVAKGLDSETRLRMSALADRALNRDDVAVLSGPSHAEEVARGIPTAVVAAARQLDQAETVQGVFSSSRFRVYTSTDMAGVELGGALKNVMAVAVGVSDGLGFGDNTRAALITRGLAEMTRIGCALGAERATFAGLAGMGDLIVTATSRHSRNRRFGEALGQGRTADDILAATKQVAEGYWNCTIVRAIAKDNAIEAPITEEICAIVHKNKPPVEAVRTLLDREPKPED